MGYLSADATLDNADASVGYAIRNTALAAGASYTATATFTTTTTTTPGNYTLFVKSDGHGLPFAGTNTDAGSVAEGDESNNTQALAITLPSKPDLTVSNASTGAITVTQAGAYTFPVTWTVTNSGGAAAQAGWNDVGYLSSDATLDNADPSVGYAPRNTALAAGASYTATTTYTTTTATAPGIYTLFVKADGKGLPFAGTNTDAGSVAEGNETNNTQALAITLPTKPDLTLSIISVGTIVKNANGSKSIPVTYTVTNNGGAAAQPSWYDYGYLSNDATLDDADAVVGYLLRSTALAAGASYTATTTYTTTTTTATG